MIAPRAVLKLGGSHAFSPCLRDWLDAIAREPGLVVTPGGGPFADAVRAAQAGIGYDDEAAHDMAMLAMAQFGRALASLHPAFALARTAAEIEAILARGGIPVWEPLEMSRAAGVPASWETTSDSLAAWLAGVLRAPTVILVKHGRFDAGALDVARLAAEGIVDRNFPLYLARSGARAFVAGQDRADRLAAALRAPIFPEIVARSPAEALS